VKSSGALDLRGDQEMVERRIGFWPGLLEGFSLAMDVEGYGNRLLNWLYEEQVPVVRRRQQEDAAKDAAEVASIRKRHPDFSDMDVALIKDNIFVTYEERDPEIDYFDVGVFLKPLGIDAYEAHQIAESLRRSDCIRTDFYETPWEVASVPPGEPEPPLPDDTPYARALITEKGVGTAERNRVRWHDRMTDSPLSQRFLVWLSSQSASGRDSAHLVNFLVSQYATCRGRPLFRLAELRPVVAYLVKIPLMSSVSGNHSADRLLGEVQLTEEGLECALGYNGRIDDYLNRGGQKADTSITIANSTFAYQSGSEVHMTQQGPGQVGGDYAGGDINKQTAGHDLIGTAAGRSNIAEGQVSNFRIDGPASLKEAFRQLSEEVNLAKMDVGDKLNALTALKWFEENVDAADEPTEASEQIGRLRSVGGWIWDKFTSLLRDLPSAGLAAWLYELARRMVTG
jgi:hypothetical protein